MREYLDMWRNYFNFSGRTSVRGYWMAILFNFIFTFGYGIIMGIIYSATESDGVLAASSIIYWLYTFACFIPGLSIVIRRLRDGGYSWPWIFMSLIPLAGAIVLIVLLCHASVSPAGQAQYVPVAQVMPGAPGAQIPTVSLLGQQSTLPSGERSKVNRLYYESDNMGARQDNIQQALAYWMGERRNLQVKPPFTMFIMPSAQSAEEALLELPFIHKAADSGKLVADRMMTFGFYETTENGAPTGKYEALVTGPDLTVQEYELAEKAFSSRGGVLKNHLQPALTASAAPIVGDASGVKYVDTTKGNDGVSLYEVYRGPDKAAAMDFLAGKTVSQRDYYIVVETPEGNFGKDIDGVYQE